ncbi:MAG: hypothetical protein ACT4P3_13145 [Betaproteobacteria bacterium]
MLRALFLAFALLLAQQVALGHALWHFDPEHSHDEGGALLCPLHAALGTVCGGVDAAPPAVAFAELVASAFQALGVGDPGLPAPSPSSRDPPSVSLK